MTSIELTRRPGPSPLIPILTVRTPFNCNFYNKIGQFTTLNLPIISHFSLVLVHLSHIQTRCVGSNVASFSAIFEPIHALQSLIQKNQ